ncbi:MAG TPA: hypothetical protein VHK64_04160 [Nocardioidaceae bacterium]|jgi:hypothetical protein|nr:hypothetical protein [Nocardioidaceae bacterium]
MNDRIAAGASAVMAALLVGTGMVRWAVRPVAVRGRHRAGPRFASLDDLMGPWSPYTEFEHAPGVIRQGFDYCAPCDRTTAGVLTRDGWTCGECLNPVGGVR